MSAIFKELFLRPIKTVLYFEAKRDNNKSISVYVFLKTKVKFFIINFKQNNKYRVMCFSTLSEAINYYNLIIL